VKDAKNREARPFNESPASRFFASFTGKRADLIVVDLNTLHMTPMYSLASHLIYAAKAADVTDHIVNSSVLLRNRRLPTLDEEAVKAAARRYQKKVVESLRYGAH
jgi:5-methylthioadenosine/S-adenosylhomocysteine deaminase